MGKLIYLAHYCALEPDWEANPAAVAVMDYVIDTIVQAGFDLTVLSPVQRNDRQARKRQQCRIREQVTCVYLPARRRFDHCLPLRLWQKLRRQRDLKQELLRLTEDGDTLMVYHAPILMDAVRWICKKRKLRLILQVCEVYADAWKRVPLGMAGKERAFLKQADGYLVMSEQLARLLCGGKPYVVCLGACKAEEAIRGDKWEGIHVVYSGTLDPKKGGAFGAVRAAAHLPEGYHLHILGVGSREEEAAVKAEIASVSRDSAAEITYDGSLYGQAYRAFLGKCHIGLSTQDPGGAFNETSFPSKILSYLSAGLRVVSARIPAVESSGLGQALYYYKNQTPQEIAQAIRNVDLKGAYDPAALVRTLDHRFSREIRQLLERDENG